MGSVSVTGVVLVAEPAARTLAASRSWSYNSNTSGATWTVPFGVSSINVVARGGAAGSGGSDGASPGAGGPWGYVAATLSVTPGDVVGLYPGNSGTSGDGCVTGYGGGTGGADSYPSANYNGGSGGAAGSVGCSGGGGGGGAASVVTLNSSIQMVAGGAGGGGGANNVSNSSSGTTGSLISGTSGGSGANGWQCSISDDGGGGGGGGGGANGGAGGTVVDNSSECKGNPGSAGSNFVIAGATSVTNTTTSSSAETITITYTPTSVSTPALASSSDTGSSNSDRITSATALTFTGTATGGSTVQLRANGVNTGSTCTATVSTGAWTCTTATLSGTPSITAVATIDGESVTSSATTVTIDTSAPTATVSTAFAQTSASVSVQSSEIGTAYIVRSTVSVSGLSSITSAVDANWNSVAVNSANTATAMSLSGLSDGSYRLYSVDTAGNLSAASTGVVTIDSVAPTVTLTGATVTNLSSVTVRSTETGTAYLARNSVAVSGLADITAADGSLWNSVTVSAANTDTSLSASGLAEGTYVAYAVDAAGNLSSVSAGSVTVTLTSQANFAVTGAPSSLGYLGTVDLGTSGGNGNGAVSFVSTTPQVCSVDSGSGVVTMLVSSGTCSIGATKAADVSYYAASTNVDIVAVKALQSALTVSGSSSGAYGDEISLSTNGGTTGGQVSWSAGVSTACSVNVSGVVTLTSGTGTCVVTATMAGTNDYESVTSAPFTVTVSKAAQTALVITSTQVTYGQTLDLAHTGGSGTGAVTWTKVSGTCSLSGTVVTPGNAGSSCVVRVTRAADANYLVRSSSDTTIEIVKAPQTSLSITSASSFVATSTLSLSAVGGLSAEPVTWAVTSGVCTVSGSTLSSTRGGVTCVVTATKPGDTNYLDVTDVKSVAVDKAVQAPLSVTGSVATLAYLATVDLGSSGGSGSGAVTFVSTTPQVCSVDAGTGVVTMLASSGTCSIGVTKAAEDLYLGASANVDITAVKALQSSLVISGDSAAAYGEVVALGVSGGSTAGAITWSEGASTACMVNSTGRVSVTAGTGTCSITATMAGSVNYEPVTSTAFTVVVSKAAQTALTVTTTDATYGEPLTLSHTGGSGTGAVTWTKVSGTCSVVGAVLTPGDAGSDCVVRVTRAGDGNFTPRSSVDTTIDIARAVQTGFMITSASTFVTGTPLTLSATGGQSGGSVSWSVSSGACTVNGSTLSAGRGGITCVVTATRAGSVNYLPVTQSISVTVDKITQVLTIRSSAPSPALVGGTYTVVVDSSAFLAPVVAVANQSQSVCSVAAGVVTFVSAGTCLISVSQAGNDTYGPAAASQSVTVTVVPPAPTTAPPSTDPISPVMTPTTAPRTVTEPTTPSGATPASAPTTTTTTTTTVPVDPTQPQMGDDGLPLDLSAGEATAVVRGQSVDVTVERVNDTIVLSLPNNVKVSIGRFDPLGESVAVAADGVLRMYRDETVDVQVTGFVPGTTYTVFMFSEPVELARGEADAEGAVVDSVRVPADVDQGEHTLQVNGVGPGGEIVSLSMGFEVVDREDNTAVVVTAMTAAILLALLGGRPIFVRRRRRRSIS